MRSPRKLPTLAAACLLLAASPLFAATTDDLLVDMQSAYARTVTPGEQADQYRDLLATVLKRIERSYATEVDLPAFVAAALKELTPLAPGAGNPVTVFKTSINKALLTLDPYSRYLDPVAHSNQSGESSGSFGGIGLELAPGDDAIRVVKVVPGSPAARAAMKEGDVIIRVDDGPLAGVPLADAVSRMRGAPGTPVTLTVRRAGSEDFTLSITRETIRRQVLHWSMADDVLVLRLASFTGRVSQALNQAVEDAKATHNPRAIVLDMRGNPGGLLREAVLTADAFLSKGEIVSLRGRTPSNQSSRQADPAELLPGLPMVVLLDGRSASASELVAAALQENGRAKVLGQRSFGKGTVQSTIWLGEQLGALKLTTAFYHGPSGKSVNRTGVAPDIEIATSSVRDASRDGATAVPRVAPARCASLHKELDPTLACAVAYLQAESEAAFLAKVGD